MIRYLDVLQLLRKLRIVCLKLVQKSKTRRALFPLPTPSDYLYLALLKKKKKRLSVNNSFFYNVRVCDSDFLQQYLRVEPGIPI